MLQDIFKYAILFILFSTIFSFFGSFLTIVLSTANGTLSYITNSTGIGLVLTSVWSFLSWAFDLLFINNSIVYVNQVIPSYIQIGSISWSLTFFRTLFGCTIIVFIISLIFGGKND